MPRTRARSGIAPLWSRAGVHPGLDCAGYFTDGWPFVQRTPGLDTPLPGTGAAGTHTSLSASYCLSIGAPRVPRKAKCRRGVFRKRRWLQNGCSVMDVTTVVGGLLRLSLAPVPAGEMSRSTVLHFRLIHLLSGKTQPPPAAGVYPLSSEAVYAGPPFAGHASNLSQISPVFSCCVCAVGCGKMYGCIIL